MSRRFSIWRRWLSSCPQRAARCRASFGSRERVICEARPGGVTSGADCSVSNGFHAASFTLRRKRYSPCQLSQLPFRALNRVDLSSKQRVGVGRRNLDLGKLADQSGVLRGEIHHAVVFCAPGQLSGVFFRIAGNQYALGRTDHRFGNLLRLLRNSSLKNV